MTGKRSDIGTRTLQAVGEMERFNCWLYSILAPFTGRTVLEVGSGIGTLTRHLAQNCEKVIALDSSQLHLDLLSSRCGSPGIQLLLGDIGTSEILPRIPSPVDTVVCVNVLEHVKDEAQAMDNMVRALAPGGRLLLYVPAFQFLYSSLDRAIDHYRRYEKEPLRKLAEAHGLRVEVLRFVNFFGVFGWLLHGKILSRKLLPEGSLKLFDRLMPFFLMVEKMIGPPIGLSLFLVGKKDG